MQYAFNVKFSEHIVEDNIGQLICTDVILARDGVYEYTSNDVFGDGSSKIVELHRDWEDVRKLRPSLEGKPVVHFHTDADIDLDNISEYKVGHAQNIRESKAEGYNVLIGDLFVTEKNTIEAVKSGELREISLGYFYDIDDSDRNRIKQVNMVGEHIAIVHRGRAGIAKILDSASEFILAKVKQDGTHSYLEYSEGKTKLNQAKWQSLKEYGYYRFNNYLEFEQSSKVTLQIIGMIVTNNPASSFVVLDEKKEIVKAYYFGKVADTSKLIEEGYDLDVFTDNVPELDPYDIPDDPRPEIDEDQELMKTALLGLKLDAILEAVDKDFGRYGDMFRGTNWRNMIALMRNNKVIVEGIIKGLLPTDDADGANLRVAENFVAGARKLAKKANDETYVNLVIITHDDCEINAQLIGSLDNAYDHLKEQKKKVEKVETIDEFIDKANETEGVVALEIKDFEEQIVVARLINNEPEVMLFKDIEELNKELSTYFVSIQEAYTRLNSKEGRFKHYTMIMF